MSDRDRNIEQQLRRLLRCFVGAGRPDEDDLFAALYATLTQDSLHPSERSALDCEPHADERSGIEGLTEARIQRALDAVATKAGLDGQALPRLVLARGTERSQVEATLAQWDLAGRPDELPMLAPLEPAESANEHEVATKPDPSDQAPHHEVAADSIEGARAKRTLERRLERSQPAAESDSETPLEWTSHTIVLTDLVGAAQIRSATFESVNSIAFHDVDDASSGERSVVGMPSQTAAKMDVLDASEALDDLERILLWSTPREDRHGLARQSSGGSLEGQVLGGKYVIHGPLGQGGFGMVYRATDRILETPVAIKVLNPRFAQREDALKSFLGEAQRLTAVDHPNIVRWISFDRTADGLHYFVMEYLEGEVLHERMKREGPLDWRRASTLILQILEALRAAHELPDGSELLHLDLKPQNVFILPGSGSSSERAKVIDFGISSFSQDPGLTDGSGPLTVGDPSSRPVSNSTGRRRKTTRGSKTSRQAESADVGTTTARRVAGGTVLYASPEQCKHIAGDEDIADLDGRADLYSLGVMAFEMLTGELPFKRPKSPVEAIKNHLSVPPLRVQQRNKNVPKKIAAFVERLLEKDRAERWGSADEAHEALNAILNPVPTWVRYIAAAAVLVAAAAVTWALNRDTARSIADFVLLDRAGESMGDLRDRTIRLEVGGAGRVLIPNLPLDPDSVDLVTPDGAPQDAFELRWVEESGGFLLRCVEPPDDPQQRLALEWSTDAGEFSSPLFQPLAIPAFELHTTTDECWSIPGFESDAGFEALAGQRAIFRTGLALSLHIEDEHASLDKDSASLVLEGGEIVPFRFEDRDENRVHYTLPLEEITPSTSTGSWHAVLTDEFGHAHSTPPIHLLLTDQPADLTVSSVTWRFDGSDRAALQVAPGSYALYATPEERSRAELVLRCHATSAAGGGTLTITNDAELALSPTVAWADDGTAELVLPLSGLPSNLAITLTDQSTLFANPATGRSTRTLSIKTPTASPCTLQLDGRPLALEATPHVLQSGQHELAIASTLAQPCLLSLTDDDVETWYVLDSARPLVTHPRVGSRRSGLDLRFYDSAALANQGCDLSQAEPGPLTEPERLEECLQGSLLCRRRVPLRLDDSLDLHISGIEAPGEPVAGDFLAQLAFEGDAPSDTTAGLREVQLELRRNETLVQTRTLAPESGFRFDGWGELDDGAYRLTVRALDGLGNRADDQLSFDVDEVGPSVTAVTPGTSEWMARDGRLPVRVQVADGNGVQMDSVFLTVAAEDGRWRDEPIRLEPRLQPGVTEASYSASQPDLVRLPVTFVAVPALTFPPERSGERVRLSISANDRLGLSTQHSWITRLGSLRPVYEPSLTSRDGMTMHLVQPPVAGSYPFAEFDLTTPASSDRRSFADVLQERAAHYATGEDLNAYFEGFTWESPPSIPNVDHVDIRPYYLDEHEVSRGQFLEFLEAEDGFEHAPLWSPVGAVPGARRLEALRSICRTGSPDLPMEGVVWAEAWCYARWAGKRLPTYFEWEFAVRGGPSSSRRLFACEHVDKRLPVPCHRSRSREYNVYAHVGLGAPAAVTGGEFVTPEGFWHLGGNVREWTATPYASSDQLDRTSRFDWLETPIEPGAEPLPRWFWIVGADYAPKQVHGLSTGQALWPEHDFKQARKQAADSARGARIGFRCAVDAADAENRVSGRIESGPPSRASALENDR